MRLKHIYDTISKGKQLYLSDHQYLENKLNLNLDIDEVIIPVNEKNEIFKEKFESDNSTIQAKKVFKIFYKTQIIKIKETQK